ncbi:MAG: glycosyltransferase family 2 protein [Deltaproteobacteria bacterium]|nr:glycosyltransferase family 2 protein [Deltaproteobacteria bacterium]
MMMDTAIFSVSYPGVEPYIPDFLHSLSKQTDKNFELFLLNDGLPDIGRFLEGIDFSVKVLEKTGHPAALRKAGIQWAISEGAELIIFADTDDYFADNHIEISKKMMVEHDVVCNEILLTGHKFPQPVPMLGGLFQDGMEITAKDIMNGNCLGLSNSSIRVDKISELMSEIPDDIIAFDWTFFTLCLHAGVKAIFTNNTQTYYRQHGNNIASPCSFSEEQILRGVKVKRDHYKFLSKHYDGYIKLSKEFERLYSELQSDVLLKDNYCKAIRINATDVSMWWEPIKTLEELRL